MKNILSLIIFFSFLGACDSPQENNNNLTEKNQTDSVVTDTVKHPTETPVTTGGLQVPTLGQFDLAAMAKDAPHKYGGGDCYGHATKYALDQTIFVTDSVSCGEYGSTYTHYLLDASGKIQAIYINEPKMQFVDGADQPTFVVREQVIDFRTDPITTLERSASFANSGEAVPNTADFTNGPLTETPADFAYWEKAYKELWLATVEED